MKQILIIKPPANYCGNCYGDTYKHCRGAKIWAVPDNDIKSDNTLSWSNMADYLYETDLITYTKTDTNEIVLPANGGGFNFVVMNQFRLDTVSDDYTITTTISPVFV